MLVQSQNIYASCSKIYALPVSAYMREHFEQRMPRHVAPKGARQHICSPFPTRTARTEDDVGQQSLGNENSYARDANGTPRRRKQRTTYARCHAHKTPRQSFGDRKHPTRIMKRSQRRMRWTERLTNRSKSARQANDETTCNAPDTRSKASRTETANNQRRPLSTDTTETEYPGVSGGEGRRSRRPQATRQNPPGRGRGIDRRRSEHLAGTLKSRLEARRIETTRCACLRPDSLREPVTPALKRRLESSFPKNRQRDMTGRRTPIARMDNVIRTLPRPPCGPIQRSQGKEPSDSAWRKPRPPAALNRAIGLYENSDWLSANRYWVPHYHIYGRT